MFTVATTHRFESDAARIWSEAEIAELITHVSRNPHEGEVWLLTAYAKAASDSMSAATLVKLRKEIVDD